MSTKYVYQGVEEPSVASIQQSPLAQSLAAELQNPAQPGERHSQIKRTIMPLLELGLCDAAIFAHYRQMYAGDVPDSEIEAFIAWGRTKLGKFDSGKPYSAPVKHPKYTDEQKIQNALEWLGSFRIEPADLWDASQIRDESRQVRLLKAEVARLESPARMERLSATYANQAPVAARQEIAPEALPDVAQTGAKP